MRFTRRMGVLTGVAALLAGAVFANENIKIADATAEGAWTPQLSKATEQFHVWATKQWTWHLRTSIPQGSVSRGVQFRGKISVENGELEEVSEKGGNDKGAEVAALNAYFRWDNKSKSTITFDYQQKEPFHTVSFKVKPAPNKKPSDVKLNFELGSGGKGFGPERINIGPRAVHPASSSFCVPLL